MKPLDFDVQLFDVFYIEAGEDLCVKERSLFYWVFSGWIALKEAH